MFRFQFKALIAFVFCAHNNAMASPVSFSEVLELSVEADHVLLPYGAQNQQTLVHFPVGATDAGSVLVIHGGCWSNAYGVDHALPIAAALSERGLAVWAAESRRGGDVGALAALRGVARLPHRARGLPARAARPAGGRARPPSARSR